MKNLSPPNSFPYQLTKAGKCAALVFRIQPIENLKINLCQSEQSVDNCLS
jgi:hypothetical protein